MIKPELVQRYLNSNFIVWATGYLINALGLMLAFSLLHSQTPLVPPIGYWTAMLLVLFLYMAWPAQALPAVSSLTHRWNHKRT